MLMGEDDDMEKKLSISVEHWNGARTVLAYGRVEDMCVLSCVSWEWRTVELSPRHCVPPWRRKEIRVIVLR